MPEPKIEFSSLIFIVGCIQAFFLCVLILRQRAESAVANRRYALLLLTGLLGLFGVLLLDQFLATTAYYVSVPHLTYVAAPLSMLLGPILLGLVSAEINPQTFRFKRSHLWHLVPFVVISILFVPVFTLSAENKLALFFQTGSGTIELAHPALKPLATALGLLSAIFTQGASMMIYTIISIGLLWRSRNDIGNPTKTMFGIAPFWLVAAFILFLLQIVALVAFNSIQTRFDVSEAAYFDIVLAPLTLFIFMSSYAAFRLLQPNADGSPILVPATKYEKSSLSPEQAQTIGHKLLALMASEQLYLDPNLKLPELAAQAGYSTNIISQVINRHFEKSYADFVNQYRVDAAKARLSDPDSDALILTIALDVGFRSKATFNAAFKKLVGTTPSQYRKAQLAPSPHQSE